MNTELEQLVQKLENIYDNNKSFIEDLDERLEYEEDVIIDIEEIGVENKELKYDIQYVKDNPTNEVISEISNKYSEYDEEGYK